MKREDHRVRVAAERRERMRARLIDAALLVIGERGAEGSVVDEVIRVAGVARGTYYNYYRNNDDLLQAVATEAGNEVLDAVDPDVRGQQDPAARVATGIRLCLMLARSQPHLGAFLKRAGAYMFGNTDLRDYLLRDITAGIETGRFRVAEPQLAFDLVVGPVLAAVNSMQSGKVAAGYVDRLAKGVLMALGIEDADAEALAFEPLNDPVLPSGSLIERAAALQICGVKAT